MTRKVLWGICLLLLTKSAFAQVQPKSFTEDPVKFISEMQDFFDSYEQKAGKEYIEKFNKEYWLTGKISDAHKAAAYKNANAMIKRKLKPTPDFHAYFNALMAISDNGISETTFDEWQTIFDKLAAGKSQKYFQDYIAMSEGLFRSNTFFDFGGTQWVSSSKNYTIGYDSVPYIKFPALTLRCFSKGDSSIIANTGGTYYPQTGVFIGKGGRVNWKRAGVDESTVYADLKTYKINLKSAGYTADSVTFTNKIYFKDKTLLGQLSEKIVADATEKSANYPRFSSYSNRYQIKSLFTNVDYEGGFTQVGARFIGSGVEKAPAFLIFKRNNKKFLYVESSNFSITNERVSAGNAGVRIFLDKDSITHPLISFRYNIKSDTVTLYRSDEGASQAPYYDSYHKVNMFVEQIVWKTTDPYMRMVTLPGSTQREADFQSENYYKQYIYEKIQGIETTNPLIRIRDHVVKNDSIMTFTVLDLCKTWKLTPENLRPALVPISNMGFISFDPLKDEITVHEKLFTYIKARAGKIDYDVLDFQSQLIPSDSSYNASLNLLNNDLTLRGVHEITLSDSQNVVIYPSKPGVVILKKNRNFTFAGTVVSGRFDFFGKQFAFDYDQFKLNLNNVDSVRIWVDGERKDERGKPEQVLVKSVIENLNGELLIDLPANKSGVKSYPKYPVFTASKESFVFYDKKTIQGGVYNRDKFYFKIDPFTIDSLDNFQNSSLRFLGTFASSGIFPDIRDTLRLMPDYSLGFERHVSEGAPLTMYGNKAKYNTTLRLSNNGLKGDGTINYLTSTVQSNEFTFYPDSTKGVAQTFDMKEQKGGKVEFPTAKGENVLVSWTPKKDKMSLTSQDKKFSMYNGGSEFGGTLTLSPQKLSGNGLLEFNTAEMNSKNMVFKQHIVDADTADFRLKAVELAGLAIKTDNVNAHIDFDKREGDFKSNGKGSVTTFPVNQYMCFVDNLKWFMDKSEIEMSSSKPAGGATDVNLEGPEFISIHPKQDSLRFNAPKARYDLKNYIISAKEVKYIRVADAAVFPDKGDVVIEKNAVMEPLINSKVQANSVTKYHNLFNCHTEIYSRKSYVSQGDYAYVDELKKEQLIHFGKVSPDTTGQTVAEGNIADSSKFMLSPAFDFKGKVILQANNQYLIFDGSTSVLHDCAIGKRRLAFKGEVNPNQIYIPVTDSPTDESGAPIGLGIMSTTDSTHVYSAFLSPQRSKRDVRVITANGFLFFDKASREYRISNKEKLVERSLPGNYISFDTKSCAVYGEGKMNLGADLGCLTLMPIGNATNYTVRDSTVFDLMLIADFHFQEKALDVMAEDITKQTSLAATNFDRSTFKNALTELVGKDQADKFNTQLTLYGSFPKRFPDELKYTLSFSDVKMKWNQATKSYVSVGKIGLWNINKNQINKFVDGKIQLIRKPGGDVLNIYLELDGSKWYYFTYVNGIMLAISSNEDFNKLIKEEKDDNRKKPCDTEKGQKSYRYNIGNPDDRKFFLRKIKKAEEAENGEGGDNGGDTGGSGN